MKKAFKVLGLMTFFMFTLSCSHENESEGKLRKAPKEIVDAINNANKRANRGGPCDGASSIGISVQTDFDIKRPKFSCNRGFWFCSETHTFLHCLDANGSVIWEEEICRSGNLNPAPHKYKIPLYENDGNSVILSFSKEYFKEGFTYDDYKLFSVDDERLVLPDRVLVKGEYEVFEYGENYVVKVPIKNI